MRQRGAAGADGREKVELEHRLPGGIIETKETKARQLRPGRRPAGIVDEDVKGTECLDCARHDVLWGGRVHEVGRHVEQPVAFKLREFRRDTSRDGDDPRAFSEEAPNDGQSDSL